MFAAKNEKTKKQLKMESAFISRHALLLNRYFCSALFFSPLFFLHLCPFFFSISPPFHFLYRNPKHCSRISYLINNFSKCRIFYSRRKYSRSFSFRHTLDLCFLFLYIRVKKHVCQIGKLCTKLG